MRKVLKRYKTWFGNTFILLCLVAYILLNFLQNGIEGLITGTISVLIASFIFPPFSILIDGIIK